MKIKQSAKAVYSALYALQQSSQRRDDRLQGKSPFQQGGDRWSRLKQNE